VAFHGCPIWLEVYQGKLRVHIWADVNKEDPTHSIDLEVARETARKEEGQDRKSYSDTQDRKNYT